MKDLRVAGGGAGQQTFLVLSHQPLVGVCSHVASHIVLGPGLQPGLKASVQASVDPLVGLKEMSTTQFSYWDATSKCDKTGTETFVLKVQLACHRDKNLYIYCTN